MADASAFPDQAIGATAQVATTGLSILPALHPAAQVVAVAALGLAMVAFVVLLAKSLGRRGQPSDVPVKAFLDCITEVSANAAHLGEQVETLSDVVKKMSEVIKGCSTCRWNPTVKGE